MNIYTKLTLGGLALLFLFAGTLAIGRERPELNARGPFADIWAAIERLTERVQNNETDLDFLRERAGELSEEIESIELTPGPEGPQGPQGEKGDPGSSSARLHVFDASDQDLGELYDFNPNGGTDAQYLTLLDELGVFLEIWTKNDTQSVRLLSSGISSGIFFDEESCTGEAFTRIPFGNPNGIMTYAPDRYFRGTFDTGASRTAKSYFDGSKCNSPIDETRTTYLLDEIFLPISEPLTWPLTIR